MSHATTIRRIMAGAFLLGLLAAAAALPPQQLLRAAQQSLSLAPGDQLVINCDTGLSGQIQGKQTTVICAAPAAPTATAVATAAPARMITGIAGVQEGQEVRGRLNIEAQVSAADVARVEFRLDGAKPALHTEKTKPYFFLGDTAGVPRGWDTTQWPNGAYMLTITVTTASGKQEAAMVHFRIANGAAPAPTATPASAATATPAPAATATPAPAATCDPGATPLGALPPAVPIWCQKITSGPGTAVRGANSWLDDFEHNLSFAGMGADYQVFDPSSGSSVYKAQHFRHNNHWMVDIAGSDKDGGPPWNFGGAMMRPDKSFRFENGRLVVEAEVAAGITEYGTTVWPEIIISTAPAPTQPLRDNLYAYGTFSGAWSLGCRLQAERVPICALNSPSNGRVFEVSFFQHEGAANVFGGGPWGALDKAWRVCKGTDPDLNCRDKFRWELTRDTLTLYVNGVKYMQHSGLPANKQLPDALLNGDVYVYFASWTQQSAASSVRFHWDHVAVNR